jgi:signal transduction histidine kinase
LIHGGQAIDPTPARPRVLRRIRRLGTAAVVALLATLTTLLLVATGAVLVVERDALGEGVTLGPLVGPVVASHLVLLGATSIGAMFLAGRAARTVEVLFADQDRLMLAVAHEVRSPLSRAVVALDEGSCGVLAQDRAIAEAQANIDALSSLIEDLLQTARVMSGAIALPRDEVRVDELVRSSMAGEPIGATTLRYDTRPTVLVGSEHLVRRAVANLIRNAVVHAYGAGRGEIRVRVDQDGITVRDDGPGIPAARRVELCSATPSSGRREAGGLGLPFAGWVAEVHRGRLVLRNRDGGGFEAQLRIPVRTVPRGERSDDG